MALCSQVFSHAFHFSSGTHNKLWLGFVKGPQLICAVRRTNDSSSLYFVLRREAQEEGHSKTRNLRQKYGVFIIFLGVYFHI